MVWAFNGDLEAPTFSPSLKSENHVDPKQRCCHLNMTAGKIVFYADCTHDLAGQTVEIPDWGADWT